MTKEYLIGSPVFTRSQYTPEAHRQMGLKTPGLALTKENTLELLPESFSTFRTVKPPLANLQSYQLTSNGQILRLSPSLLTPDAYHVPAAGIFHHRKDLLNLDSIAKSFIFIGQNSELGISQGNRNHIFSHEHHNLTIKVSSSPSTLSSTPWIPNPSKSPQWSRFKQRPPAGGGQPLVTTDIASSECAGNYLITAIVSTYNSERFMRECIEDLESQTIARQIEIIVIDSGSLENERGIVEEFKDSYSNIIYLRTEREPLYAAWNRAIGMARGKYLTSANTDDRHRRDAMEIMAQTLDANTDVGVVYSDQWMIYTENATFEDVQTGRIADRVPLDRPSFHPRTLLQHCFIGSQPMWRASLHDRVGLFDTSFIVGGDYEFWLRCAAEGIRFKHIPLKLGCYLNSQQSVEHSNHSRYKEEQLRIEQSYTTSGRLKRLFDFSGMANTPDDADLLEEYACDCLSSGDTNGGVFCQPERALRVYQLLSKKYNRTPNPNNVGVALVGLGRPNSFTEGLSWLTRASEIAEDHDTREKALANLRTLSKSRQEPLEVIKSHLILVRKFPQPDTRPKEQITALRTQRSVFVASDGCSLDPACTSPLVSVIIPCFNQGLYIHDAVESIIRQTFTNWECLIVNDGSTDNTAQIACALSIEFADRNIRVLNKPNGGPAEARNQGIQASRGKYILPLDADDMVLPHMLEATISLLENNRAISIAYTDAQNFGTVRGPSPTIDYSAERLKHEGLFAYCALFRKEAWNDAGGYNSNVIGYEDWDFWISCAEKGHYGRRIPEPLFMYRIKTASLVTTARKRDLYLKAQIVLNHKAIYNQEQLKWAQDIREGRLQAEKLDSGIGRIPIRYVSQSPPVPSITVIIPTFNRETLLPRAVKSVLAQTRSDLELIIVDDGSTDGTKQYVKSISDPRIRYYRHDVNKGQNAALNTGVQHANGLYIAFLDSDDEWLPHFLEKIMARFAQEPSLGAAYSRAFNMRKNGVLEDAQRFELQGSIYREALAQGFISHMISLVVRKDVFEKTGLFDTGFVVCQDDDFCFRLAKHYIVGLIPEALVIVHNDAGEERLITDRGKYAEGWRRLLSKYEAEIIEHCGYEVLAAHKEREGRLFLEFGDIPRAIAAFSRSAELLGMIHAQQLAPPDVLLQKFIPSRDMLSASVAAGIRQCLIGAH
jgi:glycosyltransferase involved in cell wall biosynthesis